MPGSFRRRLFARFAVLLLVGSAACTPHWLVEAAASARPGCLYFAPRQERVVALTLDDGPHDGTTTALLDVLARHRARATFFLISGHVPGNEPLVARIVREGHEIGNHFTEDQRSIDLTPAEFEESLLEADSVLSAFAPLRWARPGSGWYDARMVQTLEQHGYRCALGSVYPFDAQLRSSGHSTRTVLAGVRPGAVIILHDGAGRGSRSVAALERILPELARRGYRVVTLSELYAAPDENGVARAPL
jgi:peptidoglycan-N-acetylglucosamine deacetylase